MSTAWFQKTFTLPAKSRGSYLITDQVVSSLPEIKEYKVGLLNLFVQHTSCALSLNENWDSDVREDMSDALDRIAPEDRKGNLYRHSAEGLDDMPAHIKSALIGASVTIPITDGALNTDMAGFSTPTQNARTPSQQQPKQMSSRLLNMKFMQRAAATTPSATSTPTASAAQTPTTEPLAKRRRVESTTSSPSASTPGTPSNGLPYPGLSTPTASQNTGLGVAPRGGTSRFTRFEGADTEWVLDVEVAFPGDNRMKLPSDKIANANDQGSVPSSSCFGVLNGRSEEEGSEEGEEEEDDIWNNEYPTGRQTFGSFDRKRKSRASTRHDQGQDEDDQDLSSASTSDSDSDSEPDIPNSSSRSRPGQSRGATKPTAEIDSDEEMNRVRMAIEQKHRSMAGGGHLARNVSSSGKFPSLRHEAGDWKCRADGCSFYNYADNVYCMRCGTPRGESASASLAGSAGISRKTDKAGNKRKGGPQGQEAGNKKQKNKKARKTM
ncbi:secondary thiamine-phosphate synthase enzyme [Fonsecaea pedrosoi CBS 271.37]|uniref:Unplaced genomic scaffold supercont1.4, whole genome shotgun sequence n=1 Tax=Fonsecaea pedrosoi CBS 271.37 TaxID=1442368 RepID=A0A0D2H559_9EURO|nr:secondary thiamine-phosphate synthase enzyme [Fonsecaea pedrosoi CBS 271.37]KIW79819.1 secondary thiamine-phosphate synthase enzyme [Fonsecaea pedrosoi CBS 271.37]